MSSTPCVWFFSGIAQSKTVNDYDSIIITRATNVTNDPPNRNDTNNELNNENVNDPSPFCKSSGSDTANLI